LVPKQGSKIIGVTKHVDSKVSDGKIQYGGT